jgi:hypothetical protein
MRFAATGCDDSKYAWRDSNPWPQLRIRPTVYGKPRVCALQNPMQLAPLSRS